MEIENKMIVFRDYKRMDVEEILRLDISINNLIITKNSNMNKNVLIQLLPIGESNNFLTRFDRFWDKEMRHLGQRE